jgi:hypothetical protein
VAAEDPRRQTRGPRVDPATGHARVVCARLRVLTRLCAPLGEKGSAEPPAARANYLTQSWSSSVPTPGGTGSCPRVWRRGPPCSGRRAGSPRLVRRALGRPPPRPRWLASRRTSEAPRPATSSCRYEGRRTLRDFCDRIDDLITLAFLDGCQLAGADMAELNEGRADAVREMSERYASEIRRAVLETALDPTGGLVRPQELLD